MRPDILKAMKEGTSAKDKTKRFREKLKEKKKAKIKKLIEEVNFKDFDDFKDKIKFGEVVQAPPSLTVIPKKRDKINHLKKDNLDNSKGQKMNHLNVANKRIIAEERKRVMAQYRLVKARKLINKNSYSED
ncbi:21628_t:CDS:2 [Rhizophagus irregularis]|nr:21628_t:CDS:2 [Rhizophagus irregularis]